MPIIMLNMGGEFLYIINQRLQAQSIQDEKAHNVLQDMAKVMFSPDFVQELFRPQDMPSITSVRQIFNKIAHSSIMRLNQNSMDKLFDLMCMAFKLQVLSCADPQQYLQVTMNHLFSARALVRSDKASELIQVAIDKMIETYRGLTMGQWLLLKQSIFQFVQGRKTKVTLFMQQNTQTSAGTVVISNGGRLPFGTEVPGTIRYFKGKEVETTKVVRMPCIAACHEADNLVDPELQLGKNMFAAGESSAPTATAAAQKNQVESVQAATAAAAAMEANPTTGRYQ
jgi:hypothetical protein